MKRVVVYPGSFDPFTLGHLDTEKRINPWGIKVIPLTMEVRDG